MIIPVITSGWRRATDGTGHPAAANRRPLPSVKRSGHFDRQRAVGDERRAGHGSICLAPPAGFRTRRGASVMTIRTAADRRRRANGGHGGALLSRADACSAARSEPMTAQRTHLLMNPGIRLGGQRWADAPHARSPLAITARNQRGRQLPAKSVPLAARHIPLAGQKNTPHGAPTKRGISTASTPSIRSRCSKIRLTQQNV
jgi:hypothetical protein